MEQTKDGHVLDLLGEMERQALAVDDALDRIETYMDEQDDTSCLKDSRSHMTVEEWDALRSRPDAPEFPAYYDAQGRE